MKRQPPNRQVTVLLAPKKRGERSEWQWKKKDKERLRSIRTHRSNCNVMQQSRSVVCRRRLLLLLLRFPCDSLFLLVCLYQAVARPLHFLSTLCHISEGAAFSFSLGCPLLLFGAFSAYTRTHAHFWPLISQCSCNWHYQQTVSICRYRQWQCSSPVFYTQTDTDRQTPSKFKNCLVAVAVAVTHWNTVKWRCTNTHIHTHTLMPVCCCCKCGPGLVTVIKTLLGTATTN